MTEQEKLESSKLYKMLPELKEAILEYQELFNVHVDAINPVKVRFSSVLPEEIIEMEIKTTKKIK